MTSNASILIAGGGEARGRRRRENRVFDERNLEYSLVRQEGQDEGETREGESLGGGRFIDWAWNYAPNRASSPSALNEVTCSLAYGDANRATIESSCISCADSPRQPSSSDDDYYERMLLRRGCTWLTLMPLLLSLSIGELSFYRSK